MGTAVQAPILKSNQTRKREYAMSTPRKDRWYIRIDGATYGPYPRIKLLDLASQGRLPCSTVLRRKGQKTWRPVAELTASPQPWKTRQQPLLAVFADLATEPKKLLQLAFLVMAASPFLGILIGPAVGLSLFWSYMLGPLIGLLIVSYVCVTLLLAETATQHSHVNHTKPKFIRH